LKLSAWKSTYSAITAPSLTEQEGEAWRPNGFNNRRRHYGGKILTLMAARLQFTAAISRAK